MLLSWPKNNLWGNACNLFLFMVKYAPMKQLYNKMRYRGIVGRAERIESIRMVEGCSEARIELASKQPAERSCTDE